MQIFSRSLNQLPRVVGAAATLGLIGVTFLIWYYFSPSFTQVGYTPSQPVPYSHRLHAGQLGLDCHRDVKAKQVSIDAKDAPKGVAYEGSDSEHIRPVAQMTNMEWKHEARVDTPRRLDPPENCWGCHR